MSGSVPVAGRPRPLGWRLISDSGSDPNSLQAAAYERTLPNGRREVVISFAGSRLWSQDWIIDINQGTGEAWPLSFLTNRRFDQALKFAETYVKQKDKDPNTSIWIVGHSLGGALAQYVSMELGLRATVFDSSALYTKKNDINISLRSGVSRQITHFYLADDPVHPLALFWPFARA
jgi:hypothetical protein